MYAPSGPSGSDDHFDRHQFNELQKRFDATANDPKARAALKKELTSTKGHTSAAKLDARIASATKKAPAKPAPKAPAKSAPKPVAKKSAPKAAAVKKKK
jgi:hypothetical protein